MKKKIIISRDLHYHHDLVFKKILNFKNYEKYIPFCISSNLIEINEDNLSEIGELEFGISGIIYKIRSRNIIYKNKIKITQIKGPFTKLNASWNVESIGQYESRVIFKADLEASYFLNLLLKKSRVEKFVNIFLDSFIEDLSNH
tara:strand:+ start:532 stop:963 length:432 start_codon:yes stop_codon:yes gene_type:complete